MGKFDFKGPECIKALLSLGFIDVTKRRGDHFKLQAPDYLAKDKPITLRRFITVPRSRKIHCQEEILKELRAFGGDKLETDFLNLV